MTDTTMIEAKWQAYLNHLGDQQEDMWTDYSDSDEPSLLIKLVAIIQSHLPVWQGGSAKQWILCFKMLGHMIEALT